MQIDVDMLYRRRLNLQRYVTSLFNDVRGINEPSDKELIRLLNDFVLDADDRALTALGNARRSDASATELMAEIRRIIRDQKNRTRELIESEVPELVEREAETTSMALGGGVDVNLAGVASEPVSGTKIGAAIVAMYLLFSRRVTTEIRQSALVNPSEMARRIRGTTTQRLRDGLFFWRDNRLIRPNIDTIVNGAASNAAQRAFEAHGITYVDHITALDFNVCPRCYTASRNGPYKTGTQPRIPIHPNCRCINAPRGAADPTDNIDKIFDRMTPEQRREYMGRTRAELWESGKIDDVRDLVNQRTLQPLRLDQLPTL